MNVGVSRAWFVMSTEIGPWEVSPSGRVLFRAVLSSGVALHLTAAAALISLLSLVPL